MYRCRDLGAIEVKRLESGQAFERFEVRDWRLRRAQALERPDVRDFRPGEVECTENRQLAEKAIGFR